MLLMRLLHLNLLREVLSPQLLLSLGDMFF
jgi:hypothetical protein